MRKYIVVLLSAVLLITSASFALENMGARPISMGGAFTGLADDANAIFFNPAGISFVSGESASFSSKLLRDEEYVALGGVQNTPYGAIGIGYVTSSSIIDELSSANSLLDQGESSVKAINRALLISYARQLNDFMVVPDVMGRLSFGTNLKFVSTKINNAKGLAKEEDADVKVDFGAIYYFNDFISAGISARDMFGSETGAGEGNFSAGLAGRLSDRAITWSVESDSFGFEYKPVKAFAVRLGQNGEYGTAGIGLSVNGVGVDYGYLAKEEPVHYVAISVSIDKQETDQRQASISSL